MGLRYKRERIMIKKYGNVRKCTRKNSGSQPHIKVYRDGVKTSKRYDGGYYLAGGVSQHQNSLTQEQLECLEKVAVTCGSDDRKIVLSIIHEFGPYCGSFT